MKMEDHFKDTLNKAVANEPPVQDAWNTFEHRVRRGRWVRWSAGVATVAVVAVAAVIAIPKIARDNRVIVPPATQPPSSSPTADPYAGWEDHARSDTMLYDARYPKGWFVSSFEGVDGLQPLAVEPLEKGMPTFAVTLRFSEGEEASMPSPGEITSNETHMTREDGRAQYRFESVADGKHEVVYRIEWTACRAGEASCHGVDGTLIVRILGETKALWDRYGQTGELIVASIQHLEPGVQIPSSSPMP